MFLIRALESEIYMIASVSIKSRTLFSLCIVVVFGLMAVALQTQQQISTRRKRQQLRQKFPILSSRQHVAFKLMDRVVSVLWFGGLLMGISGAGAGGGCDYPQAT